MICNLLSIIIPAFNESENIINIIDKVSKVCDDTKNLHEYEIIIIDDFSSDDTYQKVEQLNKENIKVIRLNKNHGSYNALRVGIYYAKGEAVTFIAADGQDDPNMIPILIDKLNEKYKVIWAIRNSRKNEKLAIKIPAKIFYFFINFFVQKNIDVSHLNNADFCLIDKDVCKKINNFNNKNLHLFYLIAWLNFPNYKVYYERVDRSIGKSKWTFSKKVNLALNTFINILTDFKEFNTDPFFNIDKSNFEL